MGNVIYVLVEVNGSCKLSVWRERNLTPRYVTVRNGIQTDIVPFQYVHPVNAYWN
jgi:hypothetical protein